MGFLLNKILVILVKVREEQLCESMLICLAIVSTLIWTALCIPERYTIQFIKNYSYLSWKKLLRWNILWWCGKRDVCVSTIFSSWRILYFIHIIESQKINNFCLPLLLVYLMKRMNVSQDKKFSLWFREILCFKNMSDVWIMESSFIKPKWSSLDYIF